MAEKIKGKEGEDKAGSMAISHPSNITDLQTFGKAKWIIVTDLGLNPTARVFIYSFLRKKEVRDEQLPPGSLFPQMKVPEGTEEVMGQGQGMEGTNQWTK